MSALSIIQLVLTLLGGVLATATKSNLPAEIVAGVQAAIAALQNVQGTPVTKAQLENLRVEPQW